MAGKIVGLGLLGMGQLLLVVAVGSRWRWPRDRWKPVRPT